MNDGRDWFKDNQPMTAIRLVRVNVKEFPKIPTSPTSGFINRIFGGNNPLEDPPETRLSYGWPSLEVNKNGDMRKCLCRRVVTMAPANPSAQVIASRSPMAFPASSEPREITPMPASAAPIATQLRSRTLSFMISQPSRPAMKGAPAWTNMMLATVV